LFQNQPETIFVNLFDEVKLDIVEEAMKWPGKETGGMLFGTIENTEDKQTISISKVVIPPEETAIRKSSYFEIDPEYSREILDQETALYLGNWHKHLGFGGPSQGDKAQIGDFFQNNPHRNTILTLIIDCLSEEEYNFILEVYRGNEISEHDSDSPSFKVITFRENNSIFESVNTSISINSISEKGISEALITRLKQELVEVYNSVNSVEDVYLLDGVHPAEKIVSFPYRFLS
jgi:hypothetical protein